MEFEELEIEKILMINKVPNFVITQLNNWDKISD